MTDTARSGAAVGSPICILSLDNTYYQFAGNAAYLHSIASAIAGQGTPLVLLIADLVEGRKFHFRLAAELAAPYAEIHVRGYARIGNRFVCASPRLVAGLATTSLRRFAGRFRRLLPASLRPARKPYLWLLQEPSPAVQRWTLAMLDRLRPAALIANYFNAAEIFPKVDPEISTAVLIHDLMNRRIETMAAAGLASDLHPDMLTREIPALDQADLLLAIQAEEAAWLRARFLNANVVDVPFVAKLSKAADRRATAPIVTFIGARNEPNCDALNWLLDDIWPRVSAARGDAELRVVGTVGQSRQTWPERAVAQGVAPSLDPVYRASAVALAPIRFGSGLKIKLVEALAAGVPVVATSAATEGLPVAPSDVVRIADRAEDFAAAILAALDAAQPEDIGAKARGYADAHFSQEAVGARIVDALLSSGPSR